MKNTTVKKHTTPVYCIQVKQKGKSILVYTYTSSKAQVASYRKEWH